MGKKIKISFCTVTYNNQGGIAEFINNLESSLYTDVDFSIFVVDNCSTDKTVEIVAKLCKQHSNITLIKAKQNGGFSAGNNLVLPYLDSDYHIVLNSDIRIQDSNELRKMIDFMEEHGEIGLLSPKLISSNGKLQKLYRRNPSILDLGLRFISPKLMRKRQAWFMHEESGYNTIGPIENASGAFMLFRTSVFKQINGFDERYFMYMEDADITRTLNQHSEAIYFPQATFVHGWNRANRRNPKHILFMLQSMRKYFAKWGWKLW